MKCSLPLAFSVFKSGLTDTRKDEADLACKDRVVDEPSWTDYSNTLLCSSDITVRKGEELHKVIKARVSTVYPNTMLSPDRKTMPSVELALLTRLLLHSLP